MELLMIRYGFMCGLSYLVALYVLHWLTPSPAWPAPPPVAAPPRGPDVSDAQVFDLLAEARRITEEG